MNIRAFALLLISCLFAPTQTAQPALSLSNRDFIAGASVLIASGVSLYNYCNYRKALHWPWSEIEKKKDFPVHKKQLPKNFLLGVGTSAYQVEGNSFNSTYYQREQTDPTYIHKAGIACDHWNRYESDINHMEQLGVGAYRFSIEWSKVQPQEHQFDTAALDHYVDVCKKLIEHGIKPVIGFHHYSDPQWFMDKGGFAHEENIHNFVQFCTVTFNYLKTKLPELFNHEPLFLTFNSPASYAANGYATGTRPPLTPATKNVTLMPFVLKNMLEAHVRVYQALKPTPDNRYKIGITHNILQLDPQYWFNPINHIKTRFAHYLVHDLVYNFFTKGTMWIPGWIDHVNKQAPHTLDFIGLNYYNHNYMPVAGQVAAGLDEERTENPRYTIYPEGLYRALQEIHTRLAKPLNIPVYITENGIATTNDAVREQYNKRCLYAMMRAHRDGYPVAGYMYWSLMDNYEWGSYDMHYGLLAVDRNTIDPKTNQPTLQRTLRKGALYFINLMRAQRKLNPIS